VPIGAVGFLHELRPTSTWAKWRTSLTKLAREIAR
jgi:hypothetical protein